MAEYNNKISNTFTQYFTISFIIRLPICSWHGRVESQFSRSDKYV